MWIFLTKNLLPCRIYCKCHFEKGSACETINHAQNIYCKAFIFLYSRNYSILTLQTKFKFELNMGDLTCLFQTVVTLKYIIEILNKFPNILGNSGSVVPIKQSFFKFPHHIRYRIAYPVKRYRPSIQVEPPFHRQVSLTSF